MIPPLAIVQARIGSTRLPRKMLLELGGKPLIWHAWNAAINAFGVENVVTAIPASEENDELAEVVRGFGVGQVFRWDGPESDVLGRLLACARTYRWRDESVIVRVTPDDPWKNEIAMAKVAAGARLPVEIGAEAFTLEMLEAADRCLGSWAALEMHSDADWAKSALMKREHVTHALFDVPPPQLSNSDSRIWPTIDTPEDYERALQQEEARRAPAP